jgi:hypothetical protein
MNDVKIFVPSTKIDTAQRLVYGVVTAEGQTQRRADGDRAVA